MSNLSQKVEIDKKLFQKMMFISNAVEHGWTVKKSDETYVFKKKHEGRREYFDEKYLETFLASNLSKEILSQRK